MKEARHVADGIKRFRKCKNGHRFQTLERSLDKPPARLSVKRIIKRINGLTPMARKAAVAFILTLPTKPQAKEPTDATSTGE